MPKFMLIIHSAPGMWERLSPEDLQRKVEKYQAWTDQLRTSGRHVYGEKLVDEGGKVVARHKGRLSFVDGPYSEAKEVVGGILVFWSRQLRGGDRPHPRVSNAG